MILSDFFSRPLLRQLFLYGIIGLLSSSLDFVVFHLLTKHAGLGYIPANCLSVTVGITTSFLLNRRFTFRAVDRTARRFLIFFLVGISGMMVSNLLLWIFIDQMGFSNLVSKLGSIVLVVGFQFTLNKYITFKQQ